MKTKKQRVIVGMSGGVDSSVAALLLKEQGYEVIGIFMKNWEEKNGEGECTATSDYQDAVKVCEQLDIPYHAIEFVKEYQDHVFKQFVEEYKKGYTPNPDVLCNREIKFKLFFEQAMKFGADFLATGHYCRNLLINQQFHLGKGVDPSKDQSYFLYTIKKEILAKVLFPVGGLLKSEVRRLAREHGLSTMEKKDSTGICFIGERNFRQFLSNYIETKPGRFENLKGEVVGKHMGVAFYTLGQRKGLGLGGPGEAWFVVGKDIKRNVVIVERGEVHPALYSDQLWANEISWVGEAPCSFPYRCKAKIRYRQQDQECVIEELNEGRVRVSFPIPQRAATPGQSIVFYDQEICLGGAVINEVAPSFYHQGRELTNILDR